MSKTKKYLIVLARVLGGLAVAFFGIFAFLDAILLPDLKNIFWLIRFGIISPALFAVILFSYSPAFRLSSVSPPSP